jgi:hypothetical protein
MLQVGFLADLLLVGDWSLRQPQVRRSTCNIRVSRSGCLSVPLASALSASECVKTAQTCCCCCCPNVHYYACGVYVYCCTSISYKSVSVVCSIPATATSLDFTHIVKQCTHATADGGHSGCCCDCCCCTRLAQQEFVSLVAELGQAQEGAAGLLIEVKGESQQQLQQRIEAAQQALRGSGVRFGGQPGAPLGLESYPFRINPAVRV